MNVGAQRVPAATPPEPSLPAAIFDFSCGKQALLTIAQPALGAILALAGLPSWRVIAIGLPAAVAVVGTAVLSPLALLFFAAAAATQVVYCALRSVMYSSTRALGSADEVAAHMRRAGFGVIARRRFAGDGAAGFIASPD